MSMYSFNSFIHSFVKTSITIGITQLRKNTAIKLLWLISVISLVLSNKNSK